MAIVCAAVWLAAAVAGCGGNDAEEGVAAAEGRLNQGGAGAAQPAAGLSDANILALLDRANLTDSAAGALAAGKAANSDLRTFARLMVRDHHAMRQETERVARRLRITPELPPGQVGVPGPDSVLAMLEAVPRGADFDKAYIDHEVAFHLDALEAAVAAMQGTQATEVQAYIQRLAPMLRDHLDRAKELQARLR